MPPTQDNPQTLLIEYRITRNTNMNEQQLRKFISDCLNTNDGTYFHGITTLVCSKEVYEQSIKSKFTEAIKLPE